MLPMRGFAQSLNVSVAAALILGQVAERARGLPDAHLPSGEQDRTLEAWLAREKVMEDRLERRANIPRTLP